VHLSAHAHMALCVKRYLKRSRQYHVVDLGSCLPPEQTLTHRDLLADYDFTYTGVDVRDGANVDVVMTQPYRIPVKSASADVVMSGQAFEHIPFFWASMLEIARVLKPGGYAFITAPSRGHVHSVYDCWRFYPDSFRAMARFAKLTLREAHTDFPPGPPRRRLNYAAIDPDYYWGDSVGVFQKPMRYPAWRMAIVREAHVRYANHCADLERIPVPEPVRRRKKILGNDPSSRGPA
jgi:SAM-dependent methyltransferase